MGFSNVTGAFGGAGPSYRGYKPNKGNIRFYEGQQRKDIEGLYGPNPYQAPGLGYGESTLQKMKSLGRGDATAEKQSLYDLYAGAKGAYGARSEEANAAQAGLARSQREAGMRQDVGLTVASEQQARQDWAARHGAVTGAYQGGAQLYNAYAMNKYQSDLNRFQERKNRYAAVGAAADSFSSLGLAGLSI